MSASTPAVPATHTGDASVPMPGLFSVFDSVPAPTPTTGAAPASGLVKVPFNSPYDIRAFVPPTAQWSNCVCHEHRGTFFMLLPDSRDSTIVDAMADILDAIGRGNDGHLQKVIAIGSGDLTVTMSNHGLHVTKCFGCPEAEEPAKAPADRLVTYTSALRTWHAHGLWTERTCVSVEVAKLGRERIAAKLATAKAEVASLRAALAAAQERMETIARIASCGPLKRRRTASDADTE